jgi:hypothetical protein
MADRPALIQDRRISSTCMHVSGSWPCPHYVASYHLPLGMAHSCLPPVAHSTHAAASHGLHATRQISTPSPCCPKVMRDSCSGHASSCAAEPRNLPTLPQWCNLWGDIAHTCLLAWRTCLHDTHAAGAACMQHVMPHSHAAAHPPGAACTTIRHGTPSYPQFRTTLRNHHTGIGTAVKAPAALYAPCTLL